MSVGPASREANAHPEQSGGYLPPSASQSGYYQHVFHPHQPVYVDNSLPSSDYDPHFRTPLSSHSTSLPQYGYPPTINQSGRQQEAQCPPPLIHHPTQSGHPNTHSQSMDRDLSSVGESLHNEEETTVQGGRKGGKRRPVNQPQNPAPKKAKQTASSGEAASGKSLRIPKACLNCRGLKTKCTGAGQDTPSCAQCLHKNIECRFDNSDPGQKLKQKRGNLSWQLKRLKGDLDTLESLRFRPVFTPEAPSSEETSSPSRTISDDTQSSGDLPVIDLPNPAHQGTAAKASNQPRELASRAGTQLNLMSTSRLRRSYAERQVKPEILEFINVAEIAELFNLYFDHLSVQCGLLDRDFHTPSVVGARSPFLLTTICAISAKFYTKNSGYYPKLAAIAKKLAFSVLERGYKTVEIVQAYVLLALWSPGSIERYERDKAWMLLGMILSPLTKLIRPKYLGLGFAIRIATDLNFHRKSVARLDDSPESLTLSKEVRNRERCWLICYALDRSLSAQMGKPHFIMEE
ncbi:hypothetical protein BDV93DRAFT_560894 [Ceratobasidium sp. AG-I]|nr:hypothetical protein BDV93DRAFT_560894 [Ceratobasidium sp. AG-I]